MKQTETDNSPHEHPEEENLQLLVGILARDCLRVMVPVHHLVVHMYGLQKEFLYLDLALDFYRVDVANSSCSMY